MTIRTDEQACLFSAFDSSGAEFTENNFFGEPKISDSQPLFLLSVLSLEYVEEANNTVQ
jgi:hypothetical protein